MIGGFRGDHPEVVKALARGRGGDRRRLGARAAPSRRRQGLGDGPAFEATRIWEDILADHPTDALALRLVEDALFLPRPIARHPRLRRARPAGLGARQSADEFRPRPLRFRARGDRRPRPRRGVRPRGAGGQSRRRLGDARARPCVSRPPTATRRAIAFLKSTRDDWRPAHFMAGHNGWHLGAVPDRARPLRRGSRRLRPLRRAQARRRRDARPRRRRRAAVAARTRRRRRRRSLGGRSPSRGWRMSTTTCSPSTTCIAPSPPRARPIPATPALARFARRLRAPRLGRQSPVTAEVGRRLIDGVLAFAGGDTRGRSTRSCRSATRRPHRRQPCSARHRQPDADRRGRRSGRWSLARALLAERAAVRPTARVKAAYERARGPTRRDKPLSRTGEGPRRGLPTAFTLFSSGPLGPAPSSGFAAPALASAASRCSPFRRGVLVSTTF